MGKRHEVSDEEWAIVDPVIPKSKVVPEQERVRLTDSPRSRTEPLQPELHSATPRSPCAAPRVVGP